MREDRPTSQARSLRRRMTEAEARLWKRLRNRGLDGLRFRRQADFGRYVADFLCHDPPLVIELDGSQHFESPNDADRDAWFAEQGYKTVRFWNRQVMQEIDSVLLTILAAAGRQPFGAPLHPPAGGDTEGGTFPARGSAASPHLGPPPQAGEEEGR